MDLRLSLSALLWLSLSGLAFSSLYWVPRLSERVWRGFLAAFFVLLSIALPVWRWRSLTYDGEINVDESQILAQALRYQIDPIPWRSVEGGSGGPLHSWAVLWAPLIGLKLNYLAARITSLACLWATSVGITLALARIAGREYALFLTLPLVTLWTGLNLDYVFFSSEQLPMALMAWSVYFTSRLHPVPKRAPAYLIGVLTGAMPFCKIQVGPAAVFLWSAAAFFAWELNSDRKKTHSVLLALIAGGLTVPTLVLAPVALGGAFGDFWNFYIKSALAYKKSPGTQVSNWASISNFLNLLWQVKEFRFFTIAEVLSGGATLVFAIKNAQNARRLTWLGLGAMGTFGILLSYGIWRTNFSFPHYTLLLTVPLALLPAGLFMLIPEEERTSKPFQRLLFGGGCLAMLSQLLFTLDSYQRQRLFLGDWGPGAHPIGEFLRNLAQPGDTMFVWGYAPKFHVFSGIPPASRFFSSIPILVGDPQNEAIPRRWLKRYLEDLEKSKPALFIDAPDEFWFPDPSVPRGVMGRHQMQPDTRAYVAAHFDFLTAINSGPQKAPILVYKRKVPSSPSEIKSP
jgi:hypothetical protein